MNILKHKNIPNCLRKYRKARGLKQKLVAKILGLKSPSLISRWEKGSSIPNSLNLIKLAVLYRTMVEGLYIDHMKLFKEELIKKEKEVLDRKNG